MTSVSIGDRVRVCDYWLARLEIGGVRAERFRGVGVVLEQERHPDGEWHSVLVQFDGCTQHFDIDDLEAAQ